MLAQAGASSGFNRVDVEIKNREIMSASLLASCRAATSPRSNSPVFLPKQLQHPLVPETQNMKSFGHFSGEFKPTAPPTSALNRFKFEV
jgi:hypothetical protein